MHTKRIKNSHRMWYSLNGNGCTGFTGTFRASEYVYNKLKLVQLLKLVSYGHVEPKQVVGNSIILNKMSYFHLVQLLITELQLYYRIYQLQYCVITGNQQRNFTIAAEQTKSTFLLDVQTSRINKLQVSVPNMLKSKIDNVVSSDNKIEVIFK